MDTAEAQKVHLFLRSKVANGYGRESVSYSSMVLPLVSFPCSKYAPKLYSCKHSLLNGVGHTYTKRHKLQGGREFGKREVFSGSKAEVRGDNGGEYDQSVLYMCRYKIVNEYILKKSHSISSIRLCSVNSNFVQRFDSLHKYLVEGPKGTLPDVYL